MSSDLTARILLVCGVLGIVLSVVISLWSVVQIFL